MKMFVSRLESPLGAMLLVTDAQHIVRALDFADHKARLQHGLREHYGEVEPRESAWRDFGRQSPQRVPVAG